MPRQETRQSGNSNTSNRGFASMDKDTQREIASKGGKTAQTNGNSHKFDSAEAREAGRKGGQSRSQNGARDLDPDLDRKVGSEIDQAAASADSQGREQGGTDVERVPEGGDVERTQGSAKDQNPRPYAEGADSGPQMTQGSHDGGSRSQGSDRGDPGQSQRDDTDRQGRAQSGSQGSGDRGGGNQGRTRDDRHGGGTQRGIH